MQLFEVCFKDPCYLILQFNQSPILGDVNLALNIVLSNVKGNKTFVIFDERNLE